jgi:hypothetical protein
LAFPWLEEGHSSAPFQYVVQFLIKISPITDFYRKPTSAAIIKTQPPFGPRCLLAVEVTAAIMPQTD